MACTAGAGWLKASADWFAQGLKGLTELNLNLSLKKLFAFESGMYAGPQRFMLKASEV